MRLCGSTWLVAVGGDEAWYVSRPRLKQMALIMQQSSGGDFLPFICILAGGLFLWSSKARNESEPVLLHFNRIFFACFTALSAFPFD